MQIRFQPPPNWDKIIEKFKVTEDMPVFYTYGDVIYSPSKIMPSADLIRHEETHAGQQEYNEDVATLWWQRYIRDPEFRLTEEAEAYGEQYRFLCQQYKDRNKRFKFLHEMAKIFSGELYGNCITYQEALQTIRELSEHGKPKLSTSEEETLA